MSNYKYLVVTDLDGTLCNSNGELSQETIKYVNSLHKRDDILFMFSTGRSWDDSKSTYATLNLKSFISCLNGSYIYNPHSKKLFCSFLNQNFCTELLSSPVTMNYIHYGILLTDKMTLPFDKTNLSKVLKTFTTNNLVPFGIKLFYKQDIETISDILQFIKNFQPMPKISIFYHKDLINIEIQSDLLNKEFAVCYFSNYFGVSPENILTFGDNHNDVSVLSGCSRSYAVANADLQIKQYAKFVSKYSNNDDAVIKEIQEFLSNIESKNLN